MGNLDVTLGKHRSEISYGANASVQARLLMTTACGIQAHESLSQASAKCVHQWRAVFHSFNGSAISILLLAVSHAAQVQ